MLNVVDISGYSRISEIASNSCDDPPRTKLERTSLFASYQKRQENVEAQLTLTSGALVTIVRLTLIMQFLKAKSVVGQALEIRYLAGNFSLLAKCFVFSNSCAC